MVAVASFVHTPGSMAFKLVGDELCTMKARANPLGRTWEMALGLRQNMKADVKRYKRMNEDTEDVATGDLKYLLTAFHLATLLSSMQNKDPGKRRICLQQAQDAYAR